MSEETQHIDQKEQKTKLGWKKIATRSLSYFSAFVLVFLIAAYFMFDYVVKMTIEQQFNANSQGQYELHIGKIRTNLFNESVKITDLKINPIGEYADSLKRIDESLNVFALEVKNTEMLVRDAKRFLLTDSLTISSFGIDTVHITYWNYKPTKEKKDPREQIKKLIASLTPELLLDSFSVKNASLDYYTTREENQFAHNINKFDITLEQIHINQNDEVEELLFTPIFDISVYDYKFKDNDHGLSVDQVNFDGETRKIDFYNVKFLKEGSANLLVPKIEVVRPQLARYVYKKDLLLDSLIIESPQVSLKGLTHQSSTSLSIKERLVETVGKFSEELKVKNITLNHADISIERLDPHTGIPSTFEIKNFSFIIDGTAVNQQNISSDSRVMFSEDISLSFDTLDFHLSKNDASLHLGKFKTDIRDEKQYLNDIRYTIPSQLDLEIAELDIYQMDWRSLWDKQEVLLTSFGVKYPSIVVFTDKSKKKKSHQYNNLSNLIVSSLPYKIDIKKMYLAHGSFRQYFHGSSTGLKSQKAQDLNLVLRNIYFDKNQEIQNPIQKILNDVQYFKFEKYELMPVHGKYKLAVQDVQLFPNRQQLDIANINLDIKDKMEVGISSFKLNGLNWENYLNNNSLDVQKIWVNNPQITARLSKQNKKSNPINIKELMPEIIYGFGSSIDVDTVLVTDGHADVVTDNKKTLIHNVDSLNLLITGFRIDSTILSQNRLLFSDDISISFENYSLKEDSTDFLFSVKDVDIPSRDSLIVFHQIKFQDENKNIVETPRLELRNIDWNNYWMTDTLQISLINLDTVNAEWELVKKVKKYTKHRSLSEVMPITIIDTLHVRKSKFEVSHHKLGKHLVDEFDILVTDLVIDSNFMKKQLPMDNCQFTLVGYEFESDQHDFDLQTSLVSGDTKSGHVAINQLAFQNHEVDFKADSLTLSQFEINKLMKEKSIHFDEIILTNSDVHYIKHSEFNNIKKHDTLSIADRVFSKFSGIYGNRLAIENMKLSAMLPHSMHKLDSLYTSFEDISVTPPDLHCADRILCSRQVSTSFKNYSYLNQSKLHQLHLASFEASSQDSLLRVTDLEYSPTLEESEFLDNLRHRKTYFSINSKEIFSNTFNFYELYNSQKLLARKLVIEQPEIMVAENLKKARKEGKVPTMPNELVRNLPIYINIDELDIHHADIVYNERSRNYQGTGTVYFTDTDVHIENITNDSTLMTKATPAVIRAHTQFMNQGSLSVLMTVPLLEENFSCEYHGTLGSMDAEIINEMLVPNANLGLRKGEVRRITFSASIEDGVAEGEMLAKYRSFKIDIYSKNQKRKTIVGSMLSNLLISKNNKKKKGTIYYESEPVDSFIKILWGGIRSGLKDTLLPGFVSNKV
ncbi:hypothetical protein OAH12_01305 [Cyclobacteriaceae bacterium]|nr:hypothetical protein [Cyclobacteriaceae bacterium]